jgi:hypothetical protein
MVDFSKSRAPLPVYFRFRFSISLIYRSLVRKSPRWSAELHVARFSLASDVCTRENVRARAHPTDAITPAPEQKAMSS